MDGKPGADIYFVVKPALLEITSIKCFLLLLYCSCETVTRYFGPFLYTKQLQHIFGMPFFRGFLELMPDQVKMAEVFFSFKFKTYSNSRIFAVVSAFLIFFLMQLHQLVHVHLSNCNFFSWIFNFHVFSWGEKKLGSGFHLALRCVLVNEITSGRH